MLDSARKLASAGADFLICPDNTIHKAFDYMEPHAPLPWLHIAEVVASEAARRGFQAQDCQAVVMGCTEIPLFLNDDNSALPTLDSTRLLARAALRQALAGR